MSNFLPEEEVKAIEQKVGALLLSKQGTTCRYDGADDNNTKITVLLSNNQIEAPLDLVLYTWSEEKAIDYDNLVKAKKITPSKKAPAPPTDDEKKEEAEVPKTEEKVTEDVPEEKAEVAEEQVTDAAPVPPATEEPVKEEEQIDAPVEEEKETAPVPPADEKKEEVAAPEPPVEGEKETAPVPPKTDTGDKPRTKAAIIKEHLYKKTYSFEQIAKAVIVELGLNEEENLRKVKDQASVQHYEMKKKGEDVGYVKANKS